MPFNTDPISILAEAARMDITTNTSVLMTEGAIMNSMKSFEEADYHVVAEMVPVIPVGEDYLVEMDYLLPFMRDNEVRSVAEALDLVAEANCLPAKSVGLIIESDECVTSTLEKANEKAKKTKNPKAKEGILKKISKVTDLGENLKKKGYKVKKKCSKKKSCKKDKK